MSTVLDLKETQDDNIQTIQNRNIAFEKMFTCIYRLNIHTGVAKEKDTDIEEIPFVVKIDD